jgi:hypothetical protein
MEVIMLWYFVEILLILGVLTSPEDFTEQELTQEINANRIPIERYIDSTNGDHAALNNWQWGDD